MLRGFFWKRNFRNLAEYFTSLEIRARENKRRNRKCECSLQARTEEEGYVKGKRGKRWKGSPSSTFQPHTAGKAIDRENLPGNPSYPRYPPVSLLVSSTPDAHHGKRAVSTIHDRNSHFFTFPYLFRRVRFLRFVSSRVLGRLFLRDGKGKERSRDKEWEKERTKDRRMMERHPLLEDFLSVILYKRWWKQNYFFFLFCLPTRRSIQGISYT